MPLMYYSTLLIFLQAKLHALVCLNFVLNQIFHYTPGITPIRCNEFAGVISSSLRLRATQLLSKNCRRVASRWQLFVEFEQSEIWTSDLPLQRRTRYRSTKCPGFSFVAFFKWLLNIAQIIEIYWAIKNTVLNIFTHFSDQIKLSRY